MENKSSKKTSMQKTATWKGFIIFVLAGIFYVFFYHFFDYITRKFIFLPKAQKVCDAQYPGSTPWLDTVIKISRRRTAFGVPDYVECHKIDGTLSPKIDMDFFSESRVLEAVGVVVYYAFQFVFVVLAFWPFYKFVYLKHVETRDAGEEGTDEHN